MFFTGDNGYQTFLVFSAMLSSLISGSNRKVINWILTGISSEKIKVINWILTGISSEKIKPFDTGLQSTMPNLADGSVKLKSNNSVLVQESLSLLYSNFILNLCIVC